MGKSLFAFLNAMKDFANRGSQLSDLESNAISQWVERLGAGWARWDHFHPRGHDQIQVAYLFTRPPGHDACRLVSEFCGLSLARTGYNVVFIDMVDPKHATPHSTLDEFDTIVVSEF